MRAAQKRVVSKMASIGHTQVTLQTTVVKPWGHWMTQGWLQTNYNYNVFSTTICQRQKTATIAAQCHKMPKSGDSLLVRYY